MHFLSLFSFLNWFTLFPKLIVLMSMLSNNYGMWLLTPTLLQELNDWLSVHSKKNRRLYTMIIIQECGFGLIPMNNSPLDPSLLWNHISPLFFIPFIWQPTIITFINYSMLIICILSLGHIKSIRAFFPNASTHQANSHLYNYIINRRD